MNIPVIDIFAGPGGLGEGFSALQDAHSNSVFKIALSIEKNEEAHKTLILRSFFRQFKTNEVPQDYYSFLKGDITLDTLYEKWPNQSKRAKDEAWQATLGEIPNDEVDRRISDSIRNRKNWLLIGGPPCQAYSVVGRSRRQEKILNEETDVRVGLYKQYLRILAIHNPSVFVMENVKGILSAKTKADSVFARILEDLGDPVAAYISEYGRNGKELACPGYKIYSLVVRPKGFNLEGNPILQHTDFVIHAEEFGIPQTRHRVILLGVRRDIDIVPDILEKVDEIPISKVLIGLPRLRSGLSKESDSNEDWKSTIQSILSKGLLTGADKEVKDEILRQLEHVRMPQQGVGKDYIPSNTIDTDYRKDWYLDAQIEGVTNHCSRGHMSSDILRYFFISCFAKVHKVSPTLKDFPIALLPAHLNVKEGIDDKKFADRFRVQLLNRPSKTITSHISKDGHYYIHPDPTQCRSFTVREAARIQTFPDNYFFCGPRTSQFIQVGNAVPPLLANKIGEVVYKLFKSYLHERDTKHTKRLKNV